MKTPANNDSADPKEQTSSKGYSWLRVILFALCVGGVIWFGMRLFEPAPDLSSTVAATTVDGAQEEPLENNQPTGSLLSRISQEIIDSAEYPFDPLLEIAASSLAKTDQHVKDYTATLISQVQLSGKLQPERTLFCKIRHPRTTGDDQCGLSVYTRFLKPESVAGQEAIWVDGWNDGNLVAHTTGFMNIKRFYLKPDSMLAMSGSRHPITEIGFRNLLAKMQETGKRDRELDDCEVTVTRNLEIDGRRCVMLEVRNAEQKDHFDFFIARIYIDNELEIPLAYEGYLWPETPGGEPVLLEKYFYTDLKINVGLQDIDFDPANEEYDYPSS